MREKSHNIYELLPRNIQDLTPEEFLNLSGDEKNNIQSIHILPPRFGGGGDFGRIRVELKRPVYSNFRWS